MHIQVGCCLIFSDSCTIISPRGSHHPTQTRYKLNHFQLQLALPPHSQDHTPCHHTHKIIHPATTLTRSYTLPPHSQDHTPCHHTHKIIHPATTLTRSYGSSNSEVSCVIHSPLTLLASLVSQALIKEEEAWLLACLSLLF